MRKYCALCGQIIVSPAHVRDGKLSYHLLCIPPEVLSPQDAGSQLELAKLLSKVGDGERVEGMKGVYRTEAVKAAARGGIRIVRGGS